MRAELNARLAAWIRRRQGEDALPLILERRRLYILPTRFGVGFGALLALMLVGGLNYANTAALFLTFLLMSFALVAMHLCHRNLLGTVLAAAEGQAVFAGERCVLQLTFENPSSADRFRLAAAVAEGHRGPTREAPAPRKAKPQGAAMPADPATTAIDLPPRAIDNLPLEVVARRRGLLKVDRIRLTSTHPFGLFRTWTWVHAPISLMVYPRPAGDLPLPPAPAGPSGGVRRSGAGVDEWMGLRTFRAGDSPRRVDWKAYARGAPLLVKEYGGASGTTRIFEHAALSHMPVEARLEQLARWVVAAEAAGERYGLRLPDVEIEPGCGSEHRHRCLAALALQPHEEPGRDVG